MSKRGGGPGFVLGWVPRLLWFWLLHPHRTTCGLWRSLTDLGGACTDITASRQLLTQDVLFNCIFFLPLMAQVRRTGLLLSL